MPRKPAVDNGNKREEMIQAASEVFFSKGYEGASVRAITTKAGCEVGLFYYYFKSKDEMFDLVLDRFFEEFHKGFAEIVEKSRRDSFRALSMFFTYMMQEVMKFRSMYENKMHRTVLWAIQERMLVIIEPYLRQILDILVSNGARPNIDLDVLSMFLTHGVGSTILHEDSTFYNIREAKVRHAINILMGLSPETADLMFPFYANAMDMQGIMELAEALKDYYPGYERSIFEKKLTEHIKSHEIFVIRNADEIAGVVMYSLERNEIDYLAVSPKYRGKGVATRLVVTAMAQFELGTKLSVVTFCENDPKGKDILKLFNKFGFRKSEEITVVDCPCQRYVKIV